MALRVLLPLLTVLAALAWGATVIVNTTTRSWFERDVSLRARLVANGAREALAGHVRAGDRKKLAAVLDEIARDDRILGAAALHRRHEDGGADGRAAGAVRVRAARRAGGGRPPTTAPISSRRRTAGSSTSPSCPSTTRGRSSRGSSSSTT